MAKPKVALYWCSSCGGCEEAVVDLNETILKVVEAVDIILWPVALDFKYEDVEKMKDGEIAVSFINGAIRSNEQEKIANMLRKKSGLVVAFGACAQLGGIPGLANFYNKETIFNYVYKGVPTVVNPENTFPQEHTKVDGFEVEIPNFYDVVKKLDEVIDVDYYLPGCPPMPDSIVAAVMAILEGKLPPKKSVIGSKKALCDTCKLKDTKPEKMKLKEFKRPYEIKIDPEHCLLDQGLVCMGPVTRSGCDNACIKGNMPCTGCYGPVDGVQDQGVKMISAIASLIDSNDEDEIQRIIETIPDPAGTFYRYSLPSTLLRRGVQK